MLQKPTPSKSCEHCGETMDRKRFSGRLEDLGVFRRRRFCGEPCWALGSRKPAPSLGALRKRSASLRGQKCETCGTPNRLQVHHVNRDPADNRKHNLMTLCASCHTRWHWQHDKRKPSLSKGGPHDLAPSSTTGSHRAARKRKTRTDASG
jgi:hypothetical protein